MPTLAWRPREKSPLEHSFDGVVMTLAGRHAAPLDVLVLRILRSACATFPVKPGYGDLIPAPGPSRVDIRLQHGGTSASTLGSFMFASTPSVSALWDRRLPRFPMYDRSSIMLPVSWRW